MTIVIKRIYEHPAVGDGYRVLVDRLWPRGISKERAALDLWLKQIAPTPALRTWFGHDPKRFKEFSDRYIEELDQNPAVDELVRVQCGHDMVTLLYGAKDPRTNHAAVLKRYMETVRVQQTGR